MTSKPSRILAELLLRGEQTLGDLRSSAARMEPIADQAALKEEVFGEENPVEVEDDGSGVCRALR